MSFIGLLKGPKYEHQAADTIYGFLSKVSLSADLLRHTKRYIDGAKKVQGGARTAQLTEQARARDLVKQFTDELGFLCWHYEGALFSIRNQNSRAFRETQAIVQSLRSLKDTNALTADPAVAQRKASVLKAYSRLCRGVTMLEYHIQRVLQMTKAIDDLDEDPTIAYEVKKTRYQKFQYQHDYSVSRLKDWIIEIGKR